MERDEIKHRFVEAGLDLDDSFEDHLLIGHGGYRLSLLAHREYWGTDQPIFEILDHEEMSTYWVEEVPTPQQALQYSRSMVGLPRSGIRPKRLLQDFVAGLGGAGRSPTRIGFGEGVYHPTVLLSRFDPRVEIGLAGLGDVVHPTSRAAF